MIDSCESVNAVVDLGPFFLLATIGTRGNECHFRANTDQLRNSPRRLILSQSLFQL
jgi:hypothetical protein